MTYLTGSQRIDGFLNRDVHVRDTPGDTGQVVGGFGNEVEYEGNCGANSYFVGGVSNEVTVNDIGRDDQVVVEGRPEDWLIYGNTDTEDGSLSALNQRTGNVVTVNVDPRICGADDAFLRDHIQFTGNYSPETRAMAGMGNWDCLGRMDRNDLVFRRPFFSPRDASIFRAGRQFGRWEEQVFGGRHSRYPYWPAPWQSRDPWFDFAPTRRPY